MPTRNEQAAILSMLSGDRVLTPFGGTLLDDERRQEAARLAREKFDHDKRQPTHLGSGFLYDPSTGQITQDPSYAEFEKEKHRQSLELYDAREDAQFQREVRAAERAQNREVRAGTQRLSGQLQTNKIPELERQIQAVDEVLGKYVGKDIPGMGGVFNVIPGLTANAREVDMVRRAVENALLLAQSGAAVTETEYERFAKAFGRSVFNTDEDFLKAWENFKGVVNARTQNIYSGFDPEVVENYEQNRGREAASADDEDADADQEWVIDESGKPVRVR